jgi:glycosyltransferase involved in cell wall biosynthesis
MNDQLRVLHFSSHFEDCGIGKYQEQFLEAMKNIGGIDNKFFETSPYQTRIMPPAAVDKVVENLRKELKDYDILHVQHEFSFYSADEFKKIINAGKSSGKKVIVTLHTSPDVASRPPHLGGLGPRSLVSYLRQIRRRRIFEDRHIKPLLRADLLIAHNDATIQSLRNAGVHDNKIVKLVLPVPEDTAVEPSKMIRPNLDKKSGDVIYCTIGFMHRFKGLFEAVKALKYLPPHYKLAIIGGIHPTSDDVKLYDKLTDMIDILNLKDRVYITGYIKDDTQMNAAIRECDVAVYPYDGKFYANVSSAALNLAFANELPVIAYPVSSFKEINQEFNEIVLCDTFSYYELARELQRIDLKAQADKVKKYAKKYAYHNVVHDLLKIYQKAATS